jgi:ribosomal protein S18 acetylase RimI-like enzyme
MTNKPIDIEFSDFESTYFKKQVYRLNKDNGLTRSALEALSGIKYELIITKSRESFYQKKLEDDTDYFNVEWILNQYRANIIESRNIGIVNYIFYDKIDKEIFDKEFKILFLRCFDHYENHYTFNKLLKLEQVGQFYIEYMKNILQKRVSNDLSGLILKDENGNSLTFILSVLNEGKVKIIFNGTDPNFENKGFYTYALQKYIHEMKSRGLEEFTIETQVNNLGVQKVWEKLGFKKDKYVKIQYVWKR